MAGTARPRLGEAGRADIEELRKPASGTTDPIKQTFAKGEHNRQSRGRGIMFRVKFGDAKVEREKTAQRTIQGEEDARSWRCKKRRGGAPKYPFQVPFLFSVEPYF